MKFALKLDANKYSDWPYVDYKGLKRLLKDRSVAPLQNGSVPSTPTSLGLKHLQAPLLEQGERPSEIPATDLFFARLRDERDAVQVFYLATIERCSGQLQLLLSQMTITSVGPSSRAESSLVRAATDLYRTLQHLRNYAILNYTALIKAAKKFDKKQQKSGEADGVLEPEEILTRWTDELSSAPFVKAEEVDNLSNQLELAFAKAFSDGSVQMARATLLVRKERPNSQLLLSLGVRVGMCLMLAFWVAWDLFIDVRVLRLDLARPRDRQWIATQLPMYRAGLAMVLLQFLWALCLYVWGKARINFEFMLDFSPRANTNAAVAFSAAARACIFYLLSALLFVKALIGELPANISPGVFPVVMFVVTFGSFLLPIRTGRDILRSLGEVLCAPLHPVHFSSVLLGDVLTSLVKPLQDVAYSVCYIGTGEFLRTYRGQGGCHDSVLLREVLTPLLCALPLWCRFMQCMRVFQDTQKRVPALPNALKYAVSMLVVLFGEVHPYLVTPGDGLTGVVLVRYLWLFTYLVSTLYTWLWDVVMDWKLGQMAEGGLRERRMFSNKGYYYAAIVVDLILRFAWTATLVPHWFSVSQLAMYKLTSVFVLPVVIVSELCRRAMWAIFRLESEHLHNTEGFRRVEHVPLHFDHAQQDDANKNVERKVEKALEAIMYVAFAALLVYAAVSLPIGDPTAPADAVPPARADDGG